jgi:hypothetical protein
MKNENNGSTEKKVTNVFHLVDRRQYASLAKPLFLLADVWESRWDVWTSRNSIVLYISPTQTNIKNPKVSPHKTSEDMASSSYSPYCVPLNETPLHAKRKLRVACVGAGFAGITLAYKIAHELKLEDIIELKIYERQVRSTYRGRTFRLAER